MHSGAGMGLKACRKSPGTRGSPEGNHRGHDHQRQHQRTLIAERQFRKGASEGCQTFEQSLHANDELLVKNDASGWTRHLRCAIHPSGVLPSSCLRAIDPEGSGNRNFAT